MSEVTEGSSEIPEERKKEFERWMRPTLTLNWEGNVDHEYEIVRPYKWMLLSAKLKGGKATYEETDVTDVFRQENGKSEDVLPSIEFIKIRRDFNVIRNTWRLKPGTYLVVRLKKDLDENKYHIMAYCYKVNEDGTAIKKQAADIHESFWSIESAQRYVQRMKDKIDCEEYFR